MPEGKWVTEYKRLWNQLVPARGQAATVQGELLRSIGKITDEAYRNGNENWDENYEKMARFVGRTLDDPTVFDSGERARIRTAVADISGQGSTYYYLAEQATRWSLHYPEPIPRQMDPSLTK